MKRIKLASSIYALVTLLCLGVSSRVSAIPRVIELSPKMRVATPKIPEPMQMTDDLQVRMLEWPHWQKASRVISGEVNRHYLGSTARLYIEGEHPGAFWGLYRHVLTLGGRSKVIVVQKVARGRSQLAEQGMTRIALLDQSQELRGGEIALIESQADRVSSFSVQSGPRQVKPTIVAFVSGRKFVATGAKLVLNKGTEDGLQPGSTFDLFTAHERGQKALSNLPTSDQRVGQLVVTYSHQSHSLATIIEATEPIDSQTLLLPATVHHSQFKSGVHDDD